MEATADQLNALFPYPKDTNVPKSPGTQVPGPVRQAGWTDASTKAVLELLKDNHQKWHIFLNDRLFHKYVHTNSHHPNESNAVLQSTAMLAITWWLSTPWGQTKNYSKPRTKRTAPVILSPRSRHRRTRRSLQSSTSRTGKIILVINGMYDSCLLGSLLMIVSYRYYQAYTAFFSSKLVGGTQHIKTVLEDYVFSKNANIVPDKGGKAPMMLSRFLGGFLHPFIHAGCGVEFGLPGLVSEGSFVAFIQFSSLIAARRNWTRHRSTNRSHICVPCISVGEPRHGECYCTAHIPRQIDVWYHSCSRFGCACSCR